jgi:hypothetical protein
MINLYKPLADFIVDTEMLLNDSLNDLTIKSSVALLGYDEVKLSEAKSLLLILEELCDNKNKENTNKYKEEEDFLNSHEVAKGEYFDLITISRIAFKNDIYAQQVLGLNNIRRKSFSGWFSQALEFCSALISNANYISVLEAYGQTISMVQVAKKQIIEAKNYYEAYKRVLGVEQQTIQMQEEIFDLLSDWVDDYKKIVRIALKDKPQVLATLGFSKEYFQEY